MDGNKSFIYALLHGIKLEVMKAFLFFQFIINVFLLTINYNCNVSHLQTFDFFFHHNFFFANYKSHKYI